MCVFGKENPVEDSGYTVKDWLGHPRAFPQQLSCKDCARRAAEMGFRECKPATDAEETMHTQLFAEETEWIRDYYYIMMEVEEWWRDSQADQWEDTDWGRVSSCHSAASSPSNWCRHQFEAAMADADEMCLAKDREDHFRELAIQEDQNMMSSAPEPMDVG